MILRAASLSFSLLEPHRESISSMKMIDGRCSLAKAKRFFTSLHRNVSGEIWIVQMFPAFSSQRELKAHFSLSPSHLDTRSEEDTEKKVELFASVATALAK